MTNSTDPGLATIRGQRDSLRHSLGAIYELQNYNRWIYSQIAPYLGARVLEIGSGTGNITQFLVARQEVLCIEPDPDFVAVLQQRVATCRNVLVVAKSIEEAIPGEVPESYYDSALCTNVLEHIEDDVAALKLMYRTLRPGGRVIILVPAMKWAFGALDRAVGHWRRYNRKSLSKTFLAAGFQVYKMRYMNFLGALGWWWHSRIRKLQFIPQQAAQKLDFLAPYLAAIERLVPPLFGQSLIGVGLK